MKNLVKRYKSPDGTIRYVKDNKLHNADGPALIHPNGKEEYYLNGILLTKDDFKKRKKESVGLPFYKQSGNKMRH
jgi:hypothetical protein